MVTQFGFNGFVILVLKTLEQRKIFYFYAQFGFKLKQRGMKLLYLVIRGYNFTSEFFSKAKDITS